jgi:hypothetical protein
MTSTTRMGTQNTLSHAQLGVSKYNYVSTLSPRNQFNVLDTINTPGRPADDSHKQNIFIDIQQQKRLKSAILGNKFR